MFGYCFRLQRYGMFPKLPNLSTTFEQTNFGIYIVYEGVKTFVGFGYLTRIEPKNAKTHQKGINSVRLYTRKHRQTDQTATDLISNIPLNPLEIPLKSIIFLKMGNYVVYLEMSLYTPYYPPFKGSRNLVPKNREQKYIFDTSRVPP